MSMAGIDSWLTFKSFEAIANGTYYDKDSPWSGYLDIDIETLIAVARGDVGAMSLASTSLITGRKMYNENIKKNRLVLYLIRLKQQLKTLW